MPPVVEAIRGDLTRQAVDAIVNAANPRMLGGGGVDGAIHRAAGPRLLEACRAVPEIAAGVRCPPGEARITPAFELPARYVIHTVGPVYRGDGSDARVLASAFRSSIELAIAWSLRSIAFPAISCGVYGYPVDEAAKVAVSVAYEAPWDLDLVRFVLVGDAVLDAFERALEARLA